MSHFDISAKNWENDPRKLEQTEIIKNNIKKYLNETDTVIDYGTGTGLIAYSIKDFVKEVIGIDNSVGMLDVLKEKITNNNVSNIKALNVNLVTDKFNQKVNSIVTTMTLHHIENIKDIFSKFSNILEDNGYLIIADLRKEDGTFHSNNQGVKHFGFDEDFLKKMFVRTKFKLIEFKNLYKFEKDGKEYDMFLSVVQK
jgi:ubiquinone/menaquinone biosynthesis C-methylase UbiE